MALKLLRSPLLLMPHEKAKRANMEWKPDRLWCEKQCLSKAEITLEHDFHNALLLCFEIEKCLCRLMVSLKHRDQYALGAHSRLLIRP